MITLVDQAVEQLKTLPYEMQWRVFEFTRARRPRHVHDFLAELVGTVGRWSHFAGRFGRGRRATRSLPCHLNGANMSIPTLTLDTNLLHEYWKQRPKVEAVEKLLLLAEQGKVSLAVTARIHEDIPNPPLAERLRELPELNISETASVTRLGYWVPGRDMLGDDAFESFFSTACEMSKQSGRRPPDWRDWDHLHAHYLLHRDFFLTWDEGIVCLTETLNARFGIVVMKPEEYARSMLS